MSEETSKLAHQLEAVTLEFAGHIEALVAALHDVDDGLDKDDVEAELLSARDAIENIDVYELTRVASDFEDNVNRASATIEEVLDKVRYGT